ncbi:large-conductance mechanosensitive channel protein MscL [Paenibacillus sp. YYML68]|uniref:large-conductance mechanosensitive channel protein MscL n=1 Tax=Paenibacillus sp. YYML68 TaxID=2909250 RepID=UPI00249093F6|nr:large-conductance mechanosensitive channel protein MscL [Paenibacillus sp. YYML68]
MKSSFWKEFKQFAMKGNMIELAVGVIIGGAFGKVVTSIVNDLIMPLVGLLAGRVNFKDLFISLNGVTYSSLEEAKKASAPTLNYGMFLSTLIDFMIVAMVIFIVVKQFQRFRKKEEEKPASSKAETKECPQCLSEIPKKASRCKYCTAVIVQTNIS